jgi:signal transduction histidine kinase
MRARSWLLLLGLYLRAHAGTISLCAAACGIMAALNALGLGDVRELYYAFLLILALGLALFGFSFARFAARQRALWRALEHLPPEPEALPEARTSLEATYRDIAMAYGRAYRGQADAQTQEELTRRDYYTLWVHQIKTPIAALNLIAQSEQAVDREQLRQELFKIEQYAEAALTYQRLGSIREDLELVPVALYPLCCKVVRRLRPLFTYGKIRLGLEPFEDEALSDEKWLGMALEQVLTNALKYTPPGGLITIAPAERQVLTVSDTGIGIRQADVPRVFERGFTGSIGRQEERSTGIGLYLCSRACRLLGHKVSLQSQLGKGTCVTFDLRRERLEVFS